MELIGQFDSPFVRRTAVTMNHHGIAFERKVLSVFTDFDELLNENVTVERSKEEKIVPSMEQEKIGDLSASQWWGSRS